MTQKEYELKCEVEKLKKENKELKNKNKDLEAQKKTYFNKLHIQNEQLRKLSNESKIDEYKEIKRKYDIAMDTIRMIKTKKNVSGGFRSKDLAENFCDIRSLFGSGKKQNKNLFEIAKKILSGETVEFVAT